MEKQTVEVAAVEYEVNEILDRRFLPSVSNPDDPTESDYEYLVSWKECGDEANTWEPLENLSKCRKKLDKFHRRISTAAAKAKRRSKRK